MAELPVPDQWAPWLLGLWQSRKMTAEGMVKGFSLCGNQEARKGVTDREREGRNQGSGCGQDILSGYAPRNLLLPARFNLLVSVLPPQCHLITSP